VCDKIVIENLEETEKTVIKYILHEFPSKRWFTSGIHRLLRRIRLSNLWIPLDWTTDAWRECWHHLRL